MYYELEVNVSLNIMKQTETHAAVITGLETGLVYTVQFLEYKETLLDYLETKLMKIF